MTTAERGLFVFVMYASLIHGIAAMTCYMGQELDPSSGGYRWVIPVENPCQCEEVHVGSLNTRAPSRPYNVSYYDTFLMSRHQIEIRRFFNCTQTQTEFPASCKAYVESGRSNGSGYYQIQPNCAGNKQLTVYCDQEANGGGWMRFYQKTGPSHCSGYNFTWTGELIQCMGVDTEILGFAVSNNVTTLKVKTSMILRDSHWQFNFSDYVNQKPLDSDVIANLANCKTPTGDSWYQDYKDGYATISGTLGTTGVWKKMPIGCGNYAYLDEQVSLRFGGMPDHGRAYFIHIGGRECEEDSQAVNIASSSWNEDNVRVVWIMTK